MYTENLSFKFYEDPFIVENHIYMHQFWDLYISKRMHGVSPYVRVRALIIMKMAGKLTD